MAQGVDPGPILDRVDYIFEKVLAPTRSDDPKRRYNNLCDRLWLIAAIEHYTAVLGDFALNCAWEDFGADPTIVDLFRWHGSEEVEHRNVAHDVATYFQDSYLARIRAMTLAVGMIYTYFERSVGYMCRADPSPAPRLVGSPADAGPRFEAAVAAHLPIPVRHLDPGLLPPGLLPEDVGSTAQAVAYLASSPAARAAHA